MDATYLAGHCPRCGTKLPPDAPEGLCAACLLAEGAGSLTMAPSDDAQTVLSPLSASAGAVAAGKQLEDGQRFGPYRIGRLLGAGGMGEVYEAEHVDTGRRLALKVLRGRLNDAEDRARFLREGQLAASVSHPHTVYIYGSEEIGGMPVISMELLPGGTLKDRVAARGPMPPVEAVTAVLDIIGGLDAAQAAGILHRDIKPSNCFTDTDGSVKVGDFGLSISTLARDVQHAGWSQGFQGTPQFAAPEQLRGEPLDLRADIYAVGATLFYLLTGEPVFEGKDLRELATRVLNDPPTIAARPAAIRPGAARLRRAAVPRERRCGASGLLCGARRPAPPVLDNGRGARAAGLPLHGRRRRWPARFVSIHAFRDVAGRAGNDRAKLPDASGERMGGARELRVLPRARKPVGCVARQTALRAARRLDVRDAVVSAGPRSAPPCTSFQWCRPRSPRSSSVRSRRRTT